MKWDNRVRLQEEKLILVVGVRRKEESGRGDLWVMEWARVGGEYGDKTGNWSFSV